VIAEANLLRQTVEVVSLSTTTTGCEKNQEKKEEKEEGRRKRTQKKKEGENSPIFPRIGEFPICKFPFKKVGE
jgi:hypothetical protein